MCCSTLVFWVTPIMKSKTISLLRNSFSKQNTRKKDKTKRLLSPENKELTASTHTYSSIEKASTGSAVGKTNTMKCCQQKSLSPAPSLLWPHVTSSLAGKPPCCYHHKARLRTGSPTLGKVCGHLLLSVLKRLSQEQSSPASDGKLQTPLLSSQWLKNAWNYPAGSKFATISPDPVEVEKYDCARTDLHPDLKQQPLTSKAT